MRDLEGDFSSSRKKGGASHKFLVIGDSECGKTTLLHNYCSEKAKKKIKKTIGCEVHIKELVKNSIGGLSISQYIEFWDLSGDSKFHPYIDVYTQAIESNISAFKGIIFFFDVTNKKSLLNLPKHLSIVATKNYGDENEEETILNPNKRRNITLPLLVVGNKSDLIESNKYKKKQEVDQFLDQVFGKDQNTNCIFVSNKMDETELNEIDNFIEDSVAGNFHKLMLYNTAKDIHSHDRYRTFTKQKLSSLRESAESLFGVILISSRWIFRKVKNLTRKNNREELII